MELILIRHGETKLNKEHKYYGSKDISLNLKGVIQSKKLKKHLNIESPPKLIVCSDLKRTRETAFYALNSKFRKVDQFNLIKFNERDFGIWEGRTADEVSKIDPLNWSFFLEEPFKATPEGGETFFSFEKRVLEQWDELIANFSEYESIWFFVHLGVLRVIIKNRLDLKENFWNIKVNPGEYKKFYI